MCDDHLRVVPFDSNSCYSGNPLLDCLELQVKQQRFIDHPLILEHEVQGPPASIYGRPHTEGLRQMGTD